MTEPGHVRDMRAIVQDRYGSADVWRLERIAPPVPGKDEVLIRVRAAGLDRGTWHAMTGQPYLMRVMGFGLRRPKQRVPGLDVAGVVVAVGGAVTRFAAGDEVFGVSRGSFAEFAVAREDKLAPKPPTLTFEQAAVVPISGMTALQGLRAGGLQAGQRVLVIGASGGVGSYAVQIARAEGAHVTGVCSAAKVDLVRSLGADEVIDYTAEDFAAGPERYDVVVDCVGNAGFARSRAVLTPGGTLLLVVADVPGILGARRASKRLGGLVTAFGASLPGRQALQQLLDLAERGEIRAVVDSIFDFDDIVEAHRRVDTGRKRGNVIVRVP